MMESDDETGLRGEDDKRHVRPKLLKHRKRMHHEDVRKRIHRAQQMELKPVTIDLSKARHGVDVLKLAVKELGWREFSHSSKKERICDVYWNTVNFDETPSHVCSGQVNKFPGMPELLSKISLSRALDQMHAFFPDEYSFYPKTWILPDEYLEFCTEAREMLNKRRKSKPTFIVKPDCGTQGEGIYLLRDPQQYVNKPNQCHVVQEYISNVLLINRYKFDLRVYCVLKSLDPLEIYICKEGLARFSTVPYELPTSKNISESYMHLTNYSLNKRSDTFVRTDNVDDGSKRTMTSVFRQLTYKGYNMENVRIDIERIICKTIIAVLPELKVLHNAALPQGKPGPSCFQILGFDILLLKNLQPILLEVNSNPSLNITQEVEKPSGNYEVVNSPLDELVKRMLVRDTLRVIAPKNKFTRNRRKKKILIDDKSEKTSNDEASEKSKSKESLPEKPAHRKSEATSIIIIRDGDIETHEQSTQTGQPAEVSLFNLDFQNRKKYKKDLSAMEEEADEDKSASDLVNDNSGVFEMVSDGEDNSEVGHLVPSQAYIEEYEEVIETCLYEVYPEMYEMDYEKLRILEDLCDMFIKFIGIKGVKKIGATGFRTFARKCALSKKGLTNASVDILFIDFNRKWEHYIPDRVAGLCFKGFVDACLEIARRKFYAPDRFEMLNSFVAFCKDHMADKREKSYLPPVSHKVMKRTVHLFARTSITSLEEAEEKVVKRKIKTRKSVEREPEPPAEVQLFLDKRKSYTDKLHRSTTFFM